MKVVKIGIAISILGLIMGGCSIKRPPNEYTAFRMATTENHGAIERTDVNGFVLDVIGSTGAPKIVVGKVNNSQIFLPKLKCITYYREDETKDRMECEEITPVSVEAKVDASGAYAGDIISSGDATEFGSSYGEGQSLVPMWVESIKSVLEQSSMKEETKRKWMDTLSGLSAIFGGGGQ